MDSLKDIFLEYVAEQIFPGNARSEVQYSTLLYRFHPDNYSLRHTEIAKKVAEKIGGDCESGINEYIKQVIKKIDHSFQDELERDGITSEALGISAKKITKGRKSGQQESPWQVAHQWLWETKYPRWQPEYVWNSWKQKAQTNSKWIQFALQPEYAPKAIKVPQPASKENLPINTPLNLKIDLDSPGSYLLLFNYGCDNEGNKTKYLIVPSQAFAPNYQLTDKITLMPQQGAMCEDIQFDAVGKEEYIGILVDEPLELPWLNPNPEHPALSWRGQHLEEVWELLQGKNWQVFYQDFQVVSQNGVNNHVSF